MLTTQTEQTIPPSSATRHRPPEPLEWKRHERQQGCIRDRARRIKDHDRNRYWLAAYFVKVRRERLWQRDPALRTARLRRLHRRGPSGQGLVPHHGRALRDHRREVHRGAVPPLSGQGHQLHRAGRGAAAARDGPKRRAAPVRRSEDHPGRSGGDQEERRVALAAGSPEAQELDQALRKVLGKGGNRRGQPRGGGDKGKGDAGALGGADAEALKQGAARAGAAAAGADRPGAGVDGAAAGDLRAAARVRAPRAGVASAAEPAPARALRGRDRRARAGGGAGRDRGGRAPAEGHRGGPVPPGRGAGAARAAAKGSTGGGRHAGRDAEAAIRQAARRARGPEQGRTGVRAHARRGPGPAGRRGRARAAGAGGAGGV